MTKALRKSCQAWLFMFLVTALLAPLAGQAQTHSVSGVVTSDDGSPLPGVYVLVKGTANGTATDSNGKYTLNAPADGTLVFTFIGMRPMERPVSGLTTLDVAMEADISELDEIVVVGYGTQKKSDLTGSVSSISSKEIRSVPVASLSQALQGRAAGVQVMQSSNSPGGGVTVRIRGGNSIQGGNEPLYVVDGYPLYNESGPTVSPNDIESMEILKDASATAIYGSRGANGVVIITTKRGKPGKANVQFETYVGFQEVRKKLDMLNATQLAELINDGIANTNADNPTKPAVAPAFTQEQIDALGKGTDWQDEIFRTAPIQNYYLAMSGGDEKMQYAITGNYFDQDGIVINSNYNRASFRLNLDRKMSERLKFSNSLTFSRSKRNQITSDTDGGGGAGVVYGALNFSPTVPVRNPDGTYTIDNRTGAIKISNPVAMANDIENENTTSRVLGTVSAEYILAKGLTAKVLFGTNLVYEKVGFYLPRSTFAGLQVSGSAYLNNRQSAEWLNENTLTYNRTINDRHTFNILAGYTLQSGTSEEFRANAQNFANDILNNNSLASAQQANPGSSEVFDWGLRSYLARVNYDLDGKYLVTLTGRMDGASKFGKGNKNAFFPSGSVAWKISKENFMSDVQAVSDLKLRASYGITGNQEIGNYQSIGALGTQNFNFDNKLFIGYAPSRMANPDLKWETTEQVNVGIDAGFFNDRLLVTADWYKKKTKDLLFNVPLPVTSGYTTSLQNIGKVQNEGVELGLATINVEGAFTWTTNFNIAANRNKVLDLGNAKDVPTGSASGHLQLANSGILRVGEPVGIFYGLIFDGIFQNAEEIAGSAQKNAKPGDRRYVDVKEDGAINSSDRVILGQAAPKFIFGFSNSFSYKGFDLNVFFQGVQGNSIYNINRYELESMTGISNQSAEVLNRWSPTNPSNTIPRAISATTSYQVTSRQIEDGSYIRLRNVQLAYNLPSTVLDRIKLTSAKIYISGQNLLTITDYSGYDPEVSRYGQETLSQGTDYGSYPSAKMYLIGVNIGF
ncbi:TonB-dependent receptor [Fulvivirgaceae bacterium PWU5]|uniref:TonB-dependent receptor n=1 Tax=Dawidia cretensis TaxID=2782350 RepID=A0AAP2DVP1_9BACT|nr:TonB-dependent receptor [Dawidia cretensis]MBT1708455.1 TonB-dependent receptor [Dawidia cretensis]